MEIFTKIFKRELQDSTLICEIVHAVGYGNSVAFLLHFVRFEYCLPSVWKKGNLIII